MSPDASTFLLVNHTCQLHGYDPRIVRGPSRRRDIVQVRRACARALREAGFSYPEIGRALGNRDHATAMNLINPRRRKTAA